MLKEFGVGFEIQRSNKKYGASKTDSSNDVRCKKSEMKLLQAEMAIAYYLVQIAKLIGLVVLVFIGIYVIGTTIRKIKEK